jgi:phosphinothricin acetyltransferase
VGGAAVAIERLTPDDWRAVREIYVEGIATGHATFETDAPSWEIWDGAHRQDARLVARRAGCVVGWAALTRVSGRCVYAGVAEVSIYVGESARGEGLGRALLEALIAASEAAGVWTLQAGIFPENAASIALHERCGFRVVGRRERLGRLASRWRDVILLERRSPRVGAE